MKAHYFLILSVIASVATSAASYSANSEYLCTKGLNREDGKCTSPVKVCAHGAGEWKCDNFKFTDHTFAMIFEGKCKILKNGHRKCGKVVINHRGYAAAQSGHCTRVCKYATDGPECKCDRCTARKITCNAEGGAFSIDPRTYHAFQTSICYVQYQWEEPHVICTSSKGEIRSSLKAYIDLLKNKCSYECSPSKPLKSCPTKTADRKDKNKKEHPKQDKNSNSEGQLVIDVRNKDDPSTEELDVPIIPQIQDEDVQTEDLITSGEVVTIQPSSVEESTIEVIDSQEEPETTNLPENGDTVVNSGGVSEPLTSNPVVSMPSMPFSPMQPMPPMPPMPSPPVPLMPAPPLPQVPPLPVPQLPSAPSPSPHISSTPEEPIRRQFDTTELSYKTGIWGDCTATCGVGTRHRDIICTLKNDTNLALPAAVCKEVLGEPPTNAAVCTMPPCETFTPITVTGKECPGTCGSGIATKSLICQSSLGTTVSLSKCGLAFTQITDVFTETISLDTTLPQTALHLPDGVCDQDSNLSAKAFGDLYENVTLYDPEQYESSQCKNRLQVNGVLQERCTIHECSKYAWRQVSDWTQCSKNCGGGTQSREVACYEDGKRVQDELCTSPKLETSRVCNTALCAASTYTWRIGPWSECDKQCSIPDADTGEMQHGYSYREVACTARDGTVVESSKCSKELRPESQMICAKAPCEFCDIEEPCSLQGNCSDRQCTCNEGYSGKRCEFKTHNCTIGAEDPACCPSTVVDKNGGCCPSGAVDKRGTCCQSDEHVDGNGFCCLGKVDACGVCGGPAVAVDVFGQCCPTTVDASGQCCISGSLDECGVCDGDGSSCNHILHISVVANHSVYTKQEDSAQNIQEHQAEATIIALSKMLHIDSSYIHVTKIGDQPVKPADLIVMRARRQLLVAGVHKSKEVKGLTSNKRELQQVSEDTNASLLTTPPETSVDMEVLIDGAAKLSTNKAVNAFMNLSHKDSSSDIAEDIHSFKSMQKIKLKSEEKQGVCGNGVCELGERYTFSKESGSCALDCGVDIQMPPYGEVHGAAKFCSGRGKPILSSGICQCYSGYVGNSCNQCMSGYITTSKPADGPPTCIMDFASDRLKVDQLPKNGNPDPRLPFSLQELPPPDTGTRTTTTEGTSAKAGPSMLGIVALGVVACAIIVGVIMIFVVKSAKQKRPPEEPTTIPDVSPTIAFRGLPDERKRTDDSGEENPVEPHLIVNAVSMGEAAAPKYTSSLDSIAEEDDEDDIDSDDWPPLSFTREDSELDRMERGL